MMQFCTRLLIRKKERKRKKECFINDYFDDGVCVSGDFITASGTLRCFLAVSHQFCKSPTCVCNSDNPLLTQSSAFSTFLLLLLSTTTSEEGDEGVVDGVVNAAELLPGGLSLERYLSCPKYRIFLGLFLEGHTTNSNLETSA